MRSADAIEKVSSQQPEYLKLFKKRLLKEVASIDQQEVKWHVVCNVNIRYIFMYCITRSGLDAYPKGPQTLFLLFFFLLWRDNKVYIIVNLGGAICQESFTFDLPADDPETLKGFL